MKPSLHLKSEDPGFVDSALTTCSLSGGLEEDDSEGKRARKKLKNQRFDLVR